MRSNNVHYVFVILMLALAATAAALVLLMSPTGLLTAQEQQLGQTSAAEPSQEINGLCRN